MYTAYILYAVQLLYSDPDVNSAFAVADQLDFVSQPWHMQVLVACQIGNMGCNGACDT